MKRNITLAVIVALIVGTGAWVLHSQPAQPTPKSSITQGHTTPALLSQMEAADAADAKKANTIPPKVLAAKIAHLRKTQKVVNGMVQIKPGQSGVVRCSGDGSSVVDSPDWAASQFSINSGDKTNDGSTDNNGLVASWGGYDDTDVGSPPVSIPSFSGSVDVLVSVPLGASGGTYTVALSSSGNVTNDQFGTATGTFTVTGDLTGSVSVTSQTYTTTSNTVNIALKADTATGLEVVSAAVSSGGGTGDTTTTPDVQHYTDSLTLTYDTEGDYTISVTYTDNQFPTANTLTVTQDIHVCFPTSEEIADYISAWGGATISPLLKLVRTSKTFDSGTGLYTSCYKVGVSYDGTNFVTSSNQGSWFTSTGWTLPDNATTSEDLTDNIGPVNFCVPSATGEEADSLDQIECRTYATTEMCGTVIGLPFINYTLPPSATRRGSGGGFWALMM